MTNHVKIRAKIRQNYDFLVRELDKETIKSVCDYLYQENIIDGDNIDTINAERTRKEMARKLLDLIRCLCLNEEDNLKFVGRLPPHLAETILNTEIKDSEEVAGTAELSECKPMQEWSVDEVCLWLQKQNFDQKVINCFREEKITGEILIALKKEEIAEFRPNVAFGDRTNIIKFRDSEVTKETTKQPVTCLNDSSISRESDSTGSSREILVSTSFRNFGRNTDSASAVTQYTHFPSESTVVDNLIKPVHRYMGAQQLDSAAVMQEFSLEIIPFICACLNDRTNGTFHLGVNKDGEIRGVIANADDFQKLLSQLIEACFSPDQHDTVKNCVRPVRLVQVVVQNTASGMQKEADTLHLVEVDVVSSHSLCTDQAFFAKALKPNSNPRCREFERTKVFRFQNGFTPVPIADKTLVQFMDNKSNLAKRRQEAEAELQNPTPKLQTSDLGKKLFRLLCPGGKSLDDDDVYPIFVMGSAHDLPQSNAETFVANTTFINSVERKVVFDFDDASAPTSVYRNHANDGRVPSQVFVVPSSETATGRQQNSNLVASLQDCLSSETVCQPWIFCNGRDTGDARDRAMSVLDWNRARRNDFLKTLDCLEEAIPRGRSVVVFLLFSKNCDVLLSVAKDVCLKFKGNWLMICETQEVATQFKDYVMNTAVADDKEFNRHCIVGMPWLHVNQVISGIAGNLITGETCIPTSSGTPIDIPRKTLNELQDIEVIGANHLSSTSIDDDALRKLDLEKEQSFYQGREVDWWNFFFRSHVLERDVLTEIQTGVRSVLSGTHCQETDEHVGLVLIDHQPGSGATTLAKNVLWELKTEYRCATLRTLTNDTANQLCQFLRYGEPLYPKPVLLLVDNFERVQDLKESLESEVQRVADNINNLPKVAFVLLVVSRCSSNAVEGFAQERIHQQFFLGHKLSAVEIQLFSRKFEYMERDSRRRKRLEPRFLLSFNILRNNFSEDYIRRTVPELVTLVTDARERKILESVAFVGVFDPDNNSLPASCFDWLMCKTTTSGAGIPSDLAWLSKLSMYLKILVNDDSRSGNNLKMKGIRVIHSSLAHEIYTVLAGNRTVSEVCLEFLRSDVFSNLGSLKNELYKIVTNVTVKRVKRTDGKYQTDFSLLVHKIRESPEDEKATIVEILKMAFDMTENVFIAQHLSRYFISLKDWAMAEQWAKIATEREPKKEVLWNTYAHVFSDQFYQRFQDSPVNAKTIEDSLQLAVKAMDLYQQEQYVNDREIGNNPTGLLYEAGIIVDLIKLLERIPKLDEQAIRLFLVTSIVPQCLQTWNEASLQTFKSLKNRAIGIQTELEQDKYRQDKDQELMSYEMKRLKERMVRTTESFDNYFGVASNDTPKHFQAEEAALYRRSRIFRLRGNTFSRILEHCRAKSVVQLQNILGLAEENVKTVYRNATDLQTFIGASIALYSLSEEALSIGDGRLLRRLTKLSQELMRMSASPESNYTPHEPYMFFALLNWPTSSSDAYQDVSQLQDALTKWKDTHQVQNPIPQRKLQNSKGRRKPFLFLGNGAGMNRIVPGTKKDSTNVEMFQGTVSSEGEQVKFVVKIDNREYCIDIEIARVENNKNRWNKTVLFEVGFTWSGPVAYVIPIDDPRRMSTDDPQRLLTADIPNLATADIQRLPTAGFQRQRLPSAGFQRLPSADFQRTAPANHQRMPIYDSQRQPKADFQGMAHSTEFRRVPKDDLQRFAHQTRGSTPSNAIYQAAYPESSLAFYNQQSFPELPRAMNPYSRQHSLDRQFQARGATWHPSPFQGTYAGIPPFVSGTMPRTPEAAFDLSGSNLFLVPQAASSNYFIRHQEAGVFHDTRQTTRPHQEGQPKPKENDDRL